MKKAICLFFSLALLFGVSAIASANTVTLPYKLSSGYVGESAYYTWAPFTVSLPSGDQLPANISSYTPTSLTLTLDVVDPYATWNVKVGNQYSTAAEVAESGFGVDANNTNDGIVTFNLLSPTTDYFQGSGYNWYDSSIEFSAIATGCHVLGATYKVNAVPTSTPEPGTIFLLGLGLAGIAFVSMKSRKALPAIS